MSGRELYGLMSDYDFLAYLDRAIDFWQAQKDKQEGAEYFIAAFQQVRASYFGEVKEL